MDDTYVLDAVRTPFGKFAGALAKVRPDDLAADVLRALLERQSGIDPADIDDIVIGNANGAGEENRNVARMAALLAKMPTSVPGVTVNRLCGSGMQAVIDAARGIAVGDLSLAVAGGVESMSRAPWVVQKPENSLPRKHETLWSTTLGWRMINPEMPEKWTISLGESAELLSDKYSISREAQDEFAARSHQRAAAAWEAGSFTSQIVPSRGEVLERDESIRPDCTPASLAKLRPVFRAGGTVTAGNSSPMNDGAAAVLLGTAAAAERAGISPLARIVSAAASGVDPQLFGLGPVEAAAKALARAGISWKDLSVVELNEAFAAQSLACLAEWPDLDPEIVNPDGGAIAIGHPLGASGARLVGGLAHQLARQGGGWGLATLCIGVGQGLAVVLRG